MVSQARFCLLSPSADSTEFFTTPRRGPVSRLGFEPAPDAAGSVRPQFEPRAIVVGQQSTKCADVHKVDWNGAAGHLLPRVDLRTLHIDDSVRRARSEPPASLSTRLEIALAQQAFGVCADTGRRRLMEEPQSVPSRAEVASQSAKLGTMESLLEKRHFHGAPLPGSSLSPLMKNRALESIDIDSHAGRRHEASPSKGGFLPQDGESWDLQAGDTSKASLRRFLEQSLLAEEHASLLGRPSFRKRQQNQRLLELERGWNTYGSCRRSNSARPALTSRQLSRASSRTSIRALELLSLSPREEALTRHSQPLLFKQTSHLSDASTSCSFDDIAERPSLESLMPSPLESPCESDEDDCSSAAVSEDEFPLGVQRVFSSMQGMPGSSSLALAAAAAFRASEANAASTVPIHRRCVGLSGRAKQVANSSLSSKHARWE